LAEGDDDDAAEAASDYVAEDLSVGKRVDNNNPFLQRF
jgi:hypothetical protein